MKQTGILIIFSSVFVIGTTIMFSILGYTILMLSILRKAFLFPNFLIINVHPSNETNLDTSNNLQSFCYGHYNHVHLIGIHDTDALDLQEKVFIPPFSS